MMNRWVVVVVVVVAVAVWGANGLDNGLGLTPAMGYNTWNDYRCNITAQDIMDSADAIVQQGLDKLGYQYVNMDDCWAQGRYPNGTIYPDPVAFPDGIKAVADYVHSLGLKFGIYTDRGFFTCAGRPGSLGFEEIDAQTYAEWGVDYLKEDSCWATSIIHEIAFAEYGKMRDALNATGRPIYFSLCGWNTWYAPVGYSLGNSWRIAGDCNQWPSVLNAIDKNAALSPYAKPGGWNDPDMLIGSDPVTAAYLTEAQSRTMFSMWSIMAAPLLIGSNIRHLNSFDLETFSNTEVIAVDQDLLGIQGIRINGSDLSTGASTYNVWGKPLSGGAYAIIFLNNGDSPADIECSADCFAQLGLPGSATFNVRDLWAHTNNGTTTGQGYIASNVASQGGSVLISLTPA